eukprot:scaffold354305_cov44-Prasinocladus_malaysianus.AAC.1
MIADFDSEFLLRHYSDPGLYVHEYEYSYDQVRNIVRYSSSYEHGQITAAEASHGLLASVQFAHAI